ncbi:A designed zinc finger protein bound To Dna, partial [Hyaloraphidium curvatum]
FACPMCGKRFTRRFNLHSHQLSHNGLRPYSCTHPGCDKSFARKHDLKRHAKLHGEKEFACPRCGGRFARGDAMERHKRS